MRPSWRHIYDKPRRSLDGYRQSILSFPRMAPLLLSTSVLYSHPTKSAGAAVRTVRKLTDLPIVARGMVTGRSD